jgi:hypothetical protein
MTTNLPKLFSPRAMKRAKSHAEKMLSGIAKCHAEGKPKRLRWLITHYFQSIDARQLAVDKAYRALPPSRRPRRQKLAEIACGLNPWQRCDEPVIVKMKRKENGDYRLVLDFGIEHRARQYLVSAVLSVVADLNPDQYLTRGGRPAAIDRVVTLRKEGYDFTLEIDLKNCFPSFVGSDLEKYLPLKKAVIDHVIMATHYRVVPGEALQYHFGPDKACDDPGNPVELAKALSNARRGIAQGSAVASIAVEMLLAYPLKSLPADARVVAYADNMLVTGKTDEETASITSTLCSALKAHPAGHLKPKYKGHSFPGELVVFLGHQITHVDTTVNIAPSLKNEAKSAARVNKALAAIVNQKISNRKRRLIANDLRHYIISWTAAFSRCDGMEKRKTAYLLQVRQLLKQLKEDACAANPETSSMLQPFASVLAAEADTIPHVQDMSTYLGGASS